MENGLLRIREQEAKDRALSDSIATYCVFGGIISMHPGDEQYTIFYMVDGKCKKAKRNRLEEAIILLDYLRGLN